MRGEPPSAERGEAPILSDATCGNHRGIDMRGLE
jgi:hypothetical protein